MDLITISTSARNTNSLSSVKSQNSNARSIENERASQIASAGTNNTGSEIYARNLRKSSDTPLRESSQDKNNTGTEFTFKSIRSNTESPENSYTESMSRRNTTGSNYQGKTRRSNGTEQNNLITDEESEKRSNSVTDRGTTSAFRTSERNYKFDTLTSSANKKSDTGSDFAYGSESDKYFRKSKKDETDTYSVGGYNIFTNTDENDDTTKGTSSAKKRNSARNTNIKTDTETRIRTETASKGDTVQIGSGFDDVMPSAGVTQDTPTFSRLREVINRTNILMGGGK